MNYRARVAVALLAASLPLVGLASSHREAPFIAGMPRVDGTDLYLFRSYEPGRQDYVTVIANYIPFEDPAGGPNFYQLDPTAVYSINIDNTGGAAANISFAFRFTNTMKGLAVSSAGTMVPVPLINVGPVDAKGDNLNVEQSYTITMISNGKNGTGGHGELLQNATLGGTHFYKPVDNIGQKSIPDYASYAGNFIYDVSIPGCSMPGRVFVGQRKEGFVVNVGDIFDLVNLNPAGPRNAEPNSLSHKNVTSIALEVPTSCLTSSSKNPIIGAWTTSSIPDNWVNPNSQDYKQVSRLANPLVNEAVIGLPDKDKFNGSDPREDAQFLKYVTNPTLPVLLNTLFGNAAMVPGTPRNDLVAVYLTGVKGLNQPAGVRPAEEMRLNTSIAPTPPDKQNDLGVLGGDKAGYPNGRRPFDDVTDITLRAAEGALCGVAGSCGSETSDPNHGTPYADESESAGPDAANPITGGAIDPADTYLDTFPYLNTPLPGAPNGPNGITPSTTTPPTTTP